MPRTPSKTAPGLYIHVPLCLSKCAYCDFYSVVDGDSAGYVEALELEIALVDMRLDKADSLYLGGGTPSVLEAAQLERLLSAIRGRFDLDKDLELTLEANPDDIDPVSLSNWRELGINRLSLGVQSFNDDELSFFGRRHSAQQAHEAISAARGAGFDNIGIDLIYGFYGQNMESWKSCLSHALEFELEHLSCYQLTIAEGTPLGRKLAAGRIKRLEEDEERRMFTFTSELLQDNGFDHYEISNFARDISLRSRHNQKYWSHIPYVGLGPSAHSFMGGERWSNVSSLKDYCARLSTGDSPISTCERLTKEQLQLEILMLGLRTSDGITTKNLEKFPSWKLKLKQVEEEGLVTVENTRVSPTLKGFLLADSLPLRLV
ncbi:MAG: radical SAM family heme chaperone HemW [Proteobacteria bacterium]|nr:radical SAM family heme chaperone HemW [Pseudomonadota bacterium]